MIMSFGMRILDAAGRLSRSLIPGLTLLEFRYNFTDGLKSLFQDPYFSVPAFNVFNSRQDKNKQCHSNYEIFLQQILMIHIK